MTYQLIHGSAHNIPIPDKSVHCLVTSPPYYGLRAYAGDQAIEWPTVEYAPMAGLAPIRVQGCEPGCDHEWADGPKRSHSGGTAKVGLTGGGAWQEATMFKTTQGAYCIHCGGWRGGLGLEVSIEAFIGHLILCLREWHRILRPEGTVWCNLGDSYAANRGYQVTDNKHIDVGNNHGSKVPSGLKPKDLMMIPARFALAAQADGWYLRSDIIWHKPNPMPESVTDRCTKAHEYIYMLAKSESYYFDADAIREPHRENARLIRDRSVNFKKQGEVGNHHQGNPVIELNPAGRNKRSVWTVSTRPYPGAHFACFPPEIPEICIRASTSAHGVCAKCSAPWRRVVERKTDPHPSQPQDHLPEYGQRANGTRGNRTANVGQYTGTSQTTGWEPTCNCQCDEVTPAVVCDPFVGSGTSIRAAMKLGRNAIGVDISDSYLGDLVPERASNIQMELAL